MHHEFPCSCTRYVSCSSAGTQGFLFIGALIALRRFLTPSGYDAWRGALHGVTGCSSGCFAALSILLDVSPEDLHRSVSLRNLLPRLTCEITRISSTLGASSVAPIVDIASNILERGGLSATLTLQHLYRFTRTECVFVCTSLMRRTRVYVSHRTHPHVRVVDAVAASCCIPGVFRPVLLDGEYMVDGNLIESVPVPFPIRDTFFLIVAPPPAPLQHSRDLTLASYTTSMLSIVTRIDTQLSAIPRHRRLCMHDETQVFDPLITDEQAVRMRFKGFMCGMSFLLTGNENLLMHTFLLCIDAYIRSSLSVDVITTDDETLPPSIAASDAVRDD